MIHWSFIETWLLHVGGAKKSMLSYCYNKEQAFASKIRYKFIIIIKGKVNTYKWTTTNHQSGGLPTVFKKHQFNPEDFLVWEFLRNLIGCFTEDWKKRNTDFSWKIKTPYWCSANRKDIGDLLRWNTLKLPDVRAYRIHNLNKSMLLYALSWLLFTILL